MFNHPKTFFSMVIAAIFSAGCSTTSHPPLPTVDSVDLERYSGRWVEIARYENRFEKGCVSASADYLLAGDSVSVTNRCYDANGTLIGEAAGRARVVEKSTNAKLKVTFFWPFEGDYWILKFSEGYRYSVVGDPSRKYLWILGRESTLTEGEQKTILEYLPTIGYDANKLYWTKPLP